MVNTYENPRIVYDTLAHNLSLQIAHLYHYGKASGLLDDDALEDILTSFRGVRRGMLKDGNGKRHKSKEAYNAMQGT